VHRLPVTYRTEALADLRDIFRVVLRASRRLKTSKGFVQRIKDRCERMATLRAEDAHATIWNPACAPCRSSAWP
jgi:hypothetical protein